MATVPAALVLEEASGLPHSHLKQETSISCSNARQQQGGSCKLRGGKGKILSCAWIIHNQLGSRQLGLFFWPLAWLRSRVAVCCGLWLAVDSGTRSVWGCSALGRLLLLALLRQHLGRLFILEHILDHGLDLTENRHIERVNIDFHVIIAILMQSRLADFVEGLDEAAEVDLVDLVNHLAESRLLLERGPTAARLAAAASATAPRGAVPTRTGGRSSADFFADLVELALELFVETLGQLVVVRVVRIVGHAVAPH
mmetsp:Transcript_21973/g.70136  ORF Transcript_21973/g.70136 Transcript_21973/m.70136 type:complete len:255 (+) Transcript_21973:2299-3063(+)